MKLNWTCPSCSCNGSINVNPFRAYEESYEPIVRQHAHLSSECETPDLDTFLISVPLPDYTDPLGIFLEGMA